MRRLPQLAALLLMILGIPVPGFTQATAAETFAEATKLFFGGDMTGAHRALERTVDLAKKEDDKPSEAIARYYLGTMFSSQSKYEESNTHFVRSLELFEQLNDRAKVASIHSYLGQNLFLLGRKTESRLHLEKALTVSEALGDLRAVATLHYSLSFYDGGERHLQLGLDWRAGPATGGLKLGYFTCGRIPSTHRMISTLRSSGWIERARCSKSLENRLTWPSC